VTVYIAEMSSVVVLTCLIVGVVDGDTLTARCEATGTAAPQTMTVRVAEIDAPERGQPFSTRAREHLAQLCHGQPAKVRPVPGDDGKDRYGRTVAHVQCNHLDAGAAQVKEGMAWAFQRYVKDEALRTSQKNARLQLRGLWAEKDPVPPWEWRRARQRGTQ
jgi:endonuclease YncB( thermonuclease family)